MLIHTARDNSVASAPRRLRRPHRRRRIRRRLQRRRRHGRIRRSGATGIIDDVSRPVVYDGHECRLWMSIGIAGAFGAAVDRQRLLVNADLALYRAKSLGRNRSNSTPQPLQAEIIDAKRTADSIIGGLERGEFIPYFQPQVDARTFEIVGVEALARWRHPTRGLLAARGLHRYRRGAHRHRRDRPRVLEGRARLPPPLAAARARRAAPVRERLAAPAARGGLSTALSDLEIAPGELSFELVESIYLDETRRRLLRYHRSDQGARHRDRDRRLRQRLRLDRQPDQDQAAAIEDRSPAGDSDHAFRGAAPPGALDRRHRQIARHRDRRRGRRDDGACALLRDLGCIILQGYAFARPMAGEELEARLRTRQRRIARAPRRRFPQMKRAPATAGAVSLRPSRRA